MKTLFLALSLLTAHAHAARPSVTYDCKALDGATATYKFTLTNDPSDFNMGGLNEVNGKPKQWTSQVVAMVVNFPDENGGVDIGDTHMERPLVKGEFAKNVVLWDMENRKPYFCQKQNGGF